jgi:hypothetical protein
VRSVRVLIVAVTVMLVSLPFAFLGIATLYEHWVIETDISRLARVCDRASALDSVQWGPLGREEHAWVRRVDDQGQVTGDSQTASSAINSSAIGGAFEAVFTALGAASTVETLTEIEARLPPLADRPELAAARAGRAESSSQPSATGQSVRVSFALPLADGAVLHATTANHRGVRQLLLARNQLAKLVLYQAVFALLVAMVLSRWLVRPLERLARGARGYPEQTLADPPCCSAATRWASWPARSIRWPRTWKPGAKAPFASRPTSRMS